MGKKKARPYAQIDDGYARSLFIYDKDYDRALVRLSTDKGRPRWHVIHDEFGEDDRGFDDDRYVVVDGVKWFFSTAVESR